jgi:hypothetical protein
MVQHVEYYEHDYKSTIYFRLLFIHLALLYSLIF